MSEPILSPHAKIFVAGHRGLVGSAIVRRLEAEAASHLLLCTPKELDLTDQTAVEAFFIEEKPEYVFMAAAKVGGILASRLHQMGWQARIGLAEGLEQTYRWYVENVASSR